MATIDKTYHKLLSTILSEGYKYEDPNRKGVHRIEIPDYKIVHDFKDGFPAITTKKLYWKGVVGELLWFLRGSSDITYLKENNINIWNKDVNNFDPIGQKSVGKSYGYHWRHFGGKPDLMPIDKSKFKIDLINPIKKSINNKIYKKDYGEYIIIKDKYKKGLIWYYDVQFLKTGYITKVQSHRFKNVNIYDPYYPSYCNVACIGIPNKKHTHYKQLRSIWKNMITRCYYDKKDKYSYYGGKGVKVSNRWKCLEYFITDVSKLDNFKAKLNDWKSYDLDKDIKGNGFLYSTETCMWSTKSNNIKESVKKKNGFDQISNLISNLKNNPMSTRHVVYNYNPLSETETSLPSCHWSFEILVEPLSIKEQSKIHPKMRDLFLKAKLGDQWEVKVNELNIPRYKFTLKWHQRSCDVFLGIPFNIASYALLAHIIGKLTNMVPKSIIGDLSNVHIYKNHLNAVKEQLSRDINKYDKCELEYFNGFKMDMRNDINQWLSSKEISDFQLNNYNSYSPIKAEMLSYDKN